MLCKAALIGFLAFVAALVAFGLIRSSGQPPQQPESYAAQEQANKTGGENGVAEAGWSAFLYAVLREPIALFTLVLAFATILLCFISFHQSQILQNTDRAAQQAANAAEKSADAANTAAAASRETVKISREQFIATHRPRVRLRRVIIEQISRTHSDTLEVGMQLVGAVEILNIGETNAFIGRSHIEVYWSETGLPAKVPFDEQSPNQFACPNAETNVCQLQVGGRINAEFKSRPLDADGMRAIENTKGASGPKLYVLGFVSYKDEGSEMRYRHHDFALVWNRGTGRFVPVKEDPDYYYDP